MAPQLASPQLVSTQWVAQACASNTPPKILDASWYLPAMSRNALEEFHTQRLPGACFFDIDRVSDTSSPYPHMLPSSTEFCAEMSTLGIGPKDHVVIYDGAGIFSAPRVWWTFKAMGHNAVSVMDGGLPKWMREDHPLEVGAPTLPTHTPYTTTQNTAWVCSQKDIYENLKNETHLVIDARPAPRFAGDVAEPRPGLAKGHIPNSLNLPFAECLTPEGTYHPPAALEALFANLNVPAEAPLITSCGSGVTAAVIFLALSLTGREDLSLYDGSWAEWGSIQGLPIEPS